MKKLFLASYFQTVARLLPDFIDCAGKKVVFIPTAAIPEKITFYVGADKKALQKLGLIVQDLEITKLPEDEIEKTIISADFIFVSGGNTFFLLQELKRKGVDKMITSHINKGKLYIGSSAGSAVVSRSIEYVKHMDNPKVAKELDGYSALGVIDFCVVPHFTNFPFRKSAEKVVKEFADTLDLKPISNNQVIIVDGEKIETLSIESKKK